MRKRPSLQYDTEKLDLLEEVSRQLKLSVVEQSVFDYFISLFLTADLKTIQRLDKLNTAIINKDYLELLDLIPERNIKQYSEDFLDMIDSDSIKNLGDYFDEDIKKEAYERGLTVLGAHNKSITEELQQNEWMSLFNQMCINDRDRTINELRFKING